MAYSAYTLAQRPRLRSHFARLHSVAWPTFLRDEVVNAVWPRLYSDFPDYQIGLCGRSGRVVAVGNTIPLAWDGTPRGLPNRIIDVINRGLDARPPTVVSAIVDPRFRARGLSRRLVTAMRDLAAAHGFRALVAPVRPSLKGHYPLTPMTRYAGWTRPDGTPFDPWLRVHRRLGARILKIVPRANTVRATVAEWEARSGLSFPESGRFIVPGAFQPIVVDRARDRVQYAEANVGMLHPL
ncbi:MAG TPA: GNAT family N-acetyltransferase [Candidatus Methylomirabilis sp.]|nr:GNAT family N-acetyltransferase [Candidatus Methylomirabilis sp.]